MNDPNIFIFSNWRQNNVINVLHVWFTFVTTYYLFSFIVAFGFKKRNINSSKKVIGLLAITQIIAFLWVIFIDLLYYILYYDIASLSETTFYEFDLPLAIVILTIGSVYFYQKHYLTPIKIKTSESTMASPDKKTLEVFKGSKSILIDHSNIAIIYVADKIVWLTTVEFESFQTNFSLASLIKELSPELFFRLNRQVIISRKIIKGYNKLDYQKLEVLADDRIPSEANLIISKYNAPNFKKWLTNSV
jgi:hypothetical protein